MQADPNSGDADTAVAESSVVAANADSFLRAAREQRQLSVDDVAHELHLTPEMILALEAGDFAAAGPRVFARGYLRNYARLLDLSQDTVLAGFPAEIPESEAFRTTAVTAQRKSFFGTYAWLLWLLVTLGLLLAAVYALTNVQDAVRTPAESAGSTEQSNSASALLPPDKVSPAIAAPLSPPVAPPGNTTRNPDAGLAADPAPVDGDIANTSPSGELPAPPMSPVAGVEDDSGTVPVPAVSVPPAGAPITPVSVAGAVSMTLKFSAECWVEIADSRRSLLYGLERAGAVVDLEGVPPFKVFLGNRKAVAIAVAGKPFSIPAGATDAGNTTRFTIEEAQL